MKTAEGCGRPCIKIPEYQVAYGYSYQNQPSIAVNKYGKRFVKEDLSYDAFHMALDRMDPMKREFPNIPFYGIFDEELRLTRPAGSAPPIPYGLPAWSADNSAEIGKGWIIKGDTIADLATKLGMDPVVLTQTLDKYNTDAAAGVDSEFGKTAGLKEIKTPPFYAVKGNPGYYGTFGSLKINTKAQVIDAFDNVIPRLYAAGKNAIGAIGYHYLTGGNCIPDGFAFGRIGGRHAAAQTPWS